MGMMPEWLAKPPAFEAFDDVFRNPANYGAALAALTAPGADLSTLLGGQVALGPNDPAHFVEDWLGAWWGGLNPPVEERLRRGLIGAMQEATKTSPHLPMEFVWVCGGPIGWSPPPMYSKPFFEVGWTRSPNQITFIVSTNFDKGMIVSGKPQPAWYLDGLNVKQVQ